MARPQMSSPQVSWFAATPSARHQQFTQLVARGFDICRVQELSPNTEAIGGGRGGARERLQSHLAAVPGRLPVSRWQRRIRQKDPRMNLNLFACPPGGSGNVDSPQHHHPCRQRPASQPASAAVRCWQCWQCCSISSLNFQDAPLFARYFAHHLLPTIPLSLAWTHPWVPLLPRTPQTQTTCEILVPLLPSSPPSGS